MAILRSQVIFLDCRDTQDFTIQHLGGLALITTVNSHLPSDKLFHYLHSEKIKMTTKLVKQFVTNDKGQSLVIGASIDKLKTQCSTIVSGSGFTLET